MTTTLAQRTRVLVEDQRVSTLLMLCVMRIPFVQITRATQRLEFVICQKERTAMTTTHAPRILAHREDQLVFSRMMWFAQPTPFARITLVTLPLESAI